MSEIEAIFKNLPENRPLYKDSGLWQVRSDDMEDVLYQQDVNETFLQFINRVSLSEFIKKVKGAI